ncbi:twisted gastrulation protein homolog 1-A-like [Tenebrio molitor]|uniref:twisted gastrulation protein homolog 1-A-like n=1 Tax=Tenebrio molitor TaxID=7067 RepID=UPI0036246E7F
MNINNNISTCYLLLVLVHLYFQIQLVQCCNENVCLSIVSKCLLLKSCVCKTKNYKCHKECFECLGTYFDICCSCLEFCPKSKIDESKLSRQSHVEKFPETIPGLFNVLTEYPDDLNRWTAITFANYVNLKNHDKIELDSEETELSTNFAGPRIFNCTVIYINSCVTLPKCKRSCYTMGAYSYRWFYNGCCECVGEYCIPFGLEIKRCQECLDEEEEAKEEEVKDLYYYDYDYYAEEMY